MHTNLWSSPRTTFCRSALLATLLLALVMPLSLQGDPAPNTPDRTPVVSAPAPSVSGSGVEVRFIDDSTLKLNLLNERLELETRFGKLVIPVREIQQIECATRISADLSRQVDAAVADLANKDFRRREAASADLLALGERAYPALLEAARGKDAEVVRRVEELLTKLREQIPEEQLAVRAHDVIQTEDSRIAGRILIASLKVRTHQFGDQALKLADVRGLRSLSAAAAAPITSLPDPGTLENFQADVGKTYFFKVTGAGGAGLGFAPVWGTDVYTVDSPLSLTAVHAGVVKPGQTAAVKVAIVGNQAVYAGSVRNGVATMPFGPFPGYRIVR